MKRFLLVFFSLLGSISFAQEEDIDLENTQIGCISGNCENGLGKYAWKNGD